MFSSSCTAIGDVVKSPSQVRGNSIITFKSMHKASHIVCISKPMCVNSLVVVRTQYNAHQSLDISTKVALENSEAPITPSGFCINLSKPLPFDKIMLRLCTLDPVSLMVTLQQQACPVHQSSPSLDMIQAGVISLGEQPESLAAVFFIGPLFIVRFEVGDPLELPLTVANRARKRRAKHKGFRRLPRHA